MSDSHLDADLPGGRRLFGMLIGVCVDNKDPERLGRIRFRIPGLFEPSSPWARPLTLGGGSKDRGIFFVPAEGAEVAVWFNQGDPEDPAYLCAQWGKPEGESEVPAEAQKENPTTALWATEDFRIEIDEGEGTKKLRVTCVPTGDTIHLDAERREIMISATTKLSLLSRGAIDIDAAVINIGGRPVRLGPEDPIG